MAATDLVRLIDLSLGIEPCGVVNFNYLHDLLHEIVKRLIRVEHSDYFPAPVLQKVTDGRDKQPKVVDSRDKQREVTDSRDKQPKVADGQDKQREVTDSRDKQLKVADGQDKQREITDGQDKQREVTDSRDKQREVTDSRDKQREVTDSRDKQPKVADGQDKQREVTDGQDKQREVTDSRDKQREVADSRDKQQEVTDSRDKQREVTDSRDKQREVADGREKQPKVADSRDKQPEVADGQDRTYIKQPDDDAESYSPLRRTRSGFTPKSKSNFVSAANDLGALDKKLQNIESRLHSVETLPELLEKKSSDTRCTPVSDMWNFTSINKRLGAAENGLDKSFKLIDDLLGEVHSLREQAGSVDSKLSENLKALENKVKDLGGLKVAVSKDSMDNAAASLLTELASKVENLQSETDTMKTTMDDLDLSVYITESDLQSYLSQHEKTLQRHEAALKSQGDSLSSTETALQGTQNNVDDLDRKVVDIGDEMDKLMAKIQEIEASLSSKVNVSDLSSLMPQGTDEGASLLPKMIELQNKLSQIESKLGSVPSDILDKISAMQAAIDSLQDQISSLSGSDDHSKFDELGAVVAQLRERISELDRAVTAISNAVSKVPREAPEPVEEEDGATKYVDTSSFEALQDMLAQIQEEQERLIGTAAHLSHELDISKDHVKSLYSNVNDLKSTKADKDRVEVEVKTKADRQALDDKASRDWVDSTFERLDKEIREARSKIIGQEETLKNAIQQMEEDVDGKLDRMELQPLKDYFDKKLDKVKPAAPVTIQEASVDDAAGFKKPLQFRCISCDKPVGIKRLAAIPALPSGGMFPETQSFRPYTTYELELIRNHQKMGSPLGAQLTQFPGSIRSAGGSHTLTRPHQRIRIAPLGSAYTSDSTHLVPPTRTNTASSNPSVHDELEVIGHDGHIYKGRTMARSRLPPLAKSKNGRPLRPSRPSTSPLQPPNVII